MIAKTKLRTIEVSIEALIDSILKISIHNMLKEYDKIKEEIKNSNNVKWIFIVLNLY